MSFLELNGWAIGTLRGSKMSPNIIGDDDRAFDGSILRDRRYVRRRWEVTTESMPEHAAQALVGFILGRGDRWTFDSDFYSDKGLPVESAKTASLRPGVAAVGGHSIVDMNSEDESKFGDASVALEPTATNLVPASSRDAEAAPAGYNAIIVGGSVLSADTNYAIEQTKSVKDVTNGTGDGLDTVGATTVASTQYTASCYVFATSAAAMQIVLYDNVGAGAIATQGFTTVANKWIRVYVTGTTPVGGVNTAIRVLNNSGGALTFYCDAFQIEAGSQATTFIDPTRSTAGNLYYDGSFLQTAEAFTFAAWVKAPTANPAALGYLLRIRESSAVNDLRIVRAAASNNLVITIYDEDGNTDSVTYAGSPWDDTWQHVAVTMRDDATVVVYLNGTAVATDTFSYFPTMASWDEIYLGHVGGGTSQWVGLIDDLILVPYAMPAEMVAALAAETTAIPTFPALRLSGDCLNGYKEYTTVDGDIRQVSHNPIMIDGVWTSAQRVSFGLEE